MILFAEAHPHADRIKEHAEIEVDYQLAANRIRFDLWLNLTVLPPGLIASASIIASLFLFAPELAANGALWIGLTLIPGLGVSVLSQYAATKIFHRRNDRARLMELETRRLEAVLEEAGVR